MKPVPLEVTMMKRIGELNAENARLKAEVKQLMVFCNCTLIPNKELQAQVERLTKAGDEVIRQWSSGDEKNAKNFMEALFVWNAAKEGKPCD